MTYPTSGTTLPTGSTSTSVDQTTGKAHGYVDRLAQGAHDTVDKMAQRSSQVGDSMRSLQSRAEHLMDSRGELIESARSYVRERPFTALLAAALVGVIASSLLRGGR